MHKHSSSISPSPTKVEKARLEQAIVQHMFRWLSIGMIVIGGAVLMLVANKNFRNHPNVTERTTELIARDHEQ